METVPRTIQTQSHDGELREFFTFGAAYTHAKNDPQVWKISFTLIGTNERIRLIRLPDQAFFVLSQLTDEMVAALRERGDHELADKLERQP
jgi:hypothetical protein